MSRSTEAPTHSRSFARRLSATLIVLVLGLLGALVPAVSASAATFSVRLADPSNNPVVGLDVDFRDSANAPMGIASSNASGIVEIDLPSGSYTFYVRDGSTDDALNVYGSSYGTVFDVDPTVYDHTVYRYVDVTGTIDNWTTEMGVAGVHVQLLGDTSRRQTTPGTPINVDVVTHTNTFTLPVVVRDESYTLEFDMDEDNAPYFGVFLGGELDDPADATHLDGSSHANFSNLHVTMPAAAAITGTVTNEAGDPLENIWVEAADVPYTRYYETQTDADGEYTLYVRPDLTYEVYAYDDNDVYDSITFDGFECGCASYTPVEPTLADPETGIDFELPLAEIDMIVAGAVVSHGFDLLPDLDVRLYRQVGSSWVFDQELLSDDGAGFGFMFNFEFLLPTSGRTASRSPTLQERSCASTMVASRRTSSIRRPSRSGADVLRRYRHRDHHRGRLPGDG